TRGRSCSAASGPPEADGVRSASFMSTSARRELCDLHEYTRRRKPSPGPRLHRAAVSPCVGGFSVLFAALVLRAGGGRGASRRAAPALPPVCLRPGLPAVRSGEMKPDAGMVPPFIDP